MAVIYFGIVLILLPNNICGGRENFDSRTEEEHRLLYFVFYRCSFPSASQKLRSTAVRLGHVTFYVLGVTELFIRRHLRQRAPGQPPATMGRETAGSR
jgi:hypothetical protein